MNAEPLPANIQDCHLLIARLQLQGCNCKVAIAMQVESHAGELQNKNTQLSLNEKLIQEQAHSVIELKSNHDQLGQKVTELNLVIEKLLKQLYGRKSERRLDGVGQLLLSLGEEAAPEVVSALEEAIQEAERIVDQADQEKRKRRGRRPGQDDRKFPEHLPRYEKLVDLAEDQREGLTLIGYDEVETLELIRAELRVRVTKYAKPATGCVRRFGLDAQSQYAWKHRDCRGVRSASAGRIPARLFETGSNDRL